MARASACKNFLLTIFPDKQPDGSFAESFDFCNYQFPQDNLEETFKCFIYQHEVGGEEGRNHIQAFVCCSRRLRYNQVADALDLAANQVHFVNVVRTPWKSWDYCSEKKDDGTRCGCPSKSFGDRPSEHSRAKVDWHQFVGLAGSETPLRTLLLQEPALIAPRIPQFRNCRQLLWSPENTPAEWSKRDVIVLWGSTGVGKSRRVREECHRQGLRLWVAPIGTLGQWFDGYDGQQVALWDDFVGGMPFRALLQLLEGNRMDVPVKGGFTCWRPSAVYFTSDRHWTQWQFPKGADQKLGPMSQEEEAQLRRRVTLCEEMKDPNPVVPPALIVRSSNV